jgi:hypothetical protein
MPGVSAVNWDQILNTMNESSSGPFFFVTRIRLLCLEDSLEHFFAPATTYFKGKPKTKFVVFGTVLSSDGGSKGPLSDQWKNKLVPIVITKTTLTGILAILAEGYELFDPETGHGINIMRSGTGTDTDYNVNPSPQPVALDLDSMEQPEKSLVEFAEALSERSAQRNGGSAGSEEAPEEWG